jgi:raffinose/stachyose/melibiose transport system permease protein
MNAYTKAKRRVTHRPAQAILTIWTILVLFPLWTMIANSFKFKFDIYKDPFGPPIKWNFESYLSVVRGGDFILFFRNSLVVTVGSIAAVLLFGSLAAYAIVNWRSKPSRWIYVFFIAGMMLPIKIGSIRLLQLVKAMGLIDTIWSLFPVYIAMGLPIAVFVLTEFIREIPHELTEAAVIDGAGRFKIFSSIIVHLLRPALATVAIFNLVPFWNDLWFPLIFINNDKHKTLMLGVTRLFGQYQTDWSKILAVLTLAAVPVILLYLSMSKQFIKGLTAGAVKG